jgi:hypothetical protein
LTGTVNARVLGVGALAEVGEVWNSPVPVMDVVGARGMMVRPGPPLLLGTGGWAWESATRISGLTVAFDDAALGVSGRAGRTGAGGSAWFVRVRERDEERETTLRTRSRRLPVDEDGVRECELLVRFTPRVFLDTGVGVGIPLSSTGELSRLTNEGGRLGVSLPFSPFTGTAAVESRSLWKELV